MAFQRIQTSNRDINLLQDNVNKALVPLQMSPLTGGTMLTKVPLTSGGNVVPHGLQRVPQFFIVTYLDNNTVVWATAAFDVNNLYLGTTANCIVSLWVN